jgi:tetratricopeptide (TPR) repeat protein
VTSSSNAKAFPALILHKIILGCLIVFSFPNAAQSQAGAGWQARAIQLGGMHSAALADPLAILGNPANLAALRDVQILLNTDDPYAVNFLGVAAHVPLWGAFAGGLSRMGASSNSNKRITLGWARHFGRRLSGGLSLSGMRANDHDYFTGAFGLQIHSPVPGTLNDDFPPTGAIFNPPALPYRYALGFHIQNIRLGERLLKTTYNIGAATRLYKTGPSIYATLALKKNDASRPMLGASVPILSRVTVNGGIYDFDGRKAALGATLVASNYNLDLVYSFARERLLLSFGFRLSASPATIARSHLERGSALAKNGEYRKALREMRRYLVFEPDNAPTTQIANLLSERLKKEDNQITSLLRQADQFEKKSWYISAAINYSKVIQLDSDNAQARRRLSLIQAKVDIYINQMFNVGVQLFDQGNLPPARRAFENILLVRKDHSEAQSYLQRIVEIQNKEAEEHFLRGLGYYSQKSYLKSIEAFEQALALNADYAEAQRYLDLAQKSIESQLSEVKRLLADADRLARRQDFPAAMQRYQQALSIDPNNQTAQEQAKRLEDRVKGYIAEKLQAGEKAYQRGSYDQAAELFRQVLATVPRNETAKAFLQRIEQQQRQRIEEIFQRGLQQFDANDFSRALNSFEEVLSLDPNYEAAKQKKQDVMAKISVAQMIERGKGFYQQNQFLKAMEVFSQVLEQDPGNAASQKYIEDCQKQLELQVDKFFNQGMDYYAAEDYREAIKMWDRALQINPNHAQSRSFKTKALERLQALEQLR